MKKKEKEKKKPKPRKKQRSNWTIPTILSLMLGIVGLIELRPQMGIYPQEQLDRSQPFSVPFLIKDDGYLSLNIKRVFCYVHEVDFGVSSISSGAQYLHGAEAALDRGGSETIVCNSVKSPLRPDRADMAVVVDYQVWIIPKTLRHYSRFVGAYGDHWEWLSQPSAGIEKAADKEIDEMIRDLPYLMPEK